MESYLWKSVSNTTEGQGETSSGGETHLQSCVRKSRKTIQKTNRHRWSHSCDEQKSKEAQTAQFAYPRKVKAGDSYDS